MPPTLHLRSPILPMKMPDTIRRIATRAPFPGHTISAKDMTSSHGPHRHPEIIMQRFTITIEEDLLGTIDAVMRRRGLFQPLRGRP